MTKYLYIFIIFIFVASCTSNTIVKKPENLISKDKMVDLLMDIHIANAGENIKNINLQRAVNYYPLVFEKHNIDSARFRESNYYYTSRIDDYDEILTRVEVRLTALKNQYDEEKKVKDSLRRKPGAPLLIDQEAEE